MVNGTTLNDRLHWYKDAIIYELHIKAFFDSNNDGIGDFGGLLQKLDYLEDLGVTAIWLLPFYPSPLRDDGYDIADYYTINPNYGTIEQFQQLLKEAHKRNLKVITELVINHTSDQHPWFQRARKAPKGSPEREYYVWSDDPHKYKDVRIIFQDFETSNWTWDPVAQQYYWHRFFHHQPDLNYDSELVQQEVFKIIDYWCAMGVDGFRLDAVPYLYEREDTNGENLPETHEYLKKLRRYIEERYPSVCFLAEANMWPEDSASYFGNGDECHMNYHFPVMPRMFMALQREDRYPITDIFDQTPAIPETCQWAIFLRNHDELTLEMVTDEERDYMYKVYAKDPKARINLGIRHRLAPLMENDRRRIELMNSLLFSLPGTPVIYYGDEIGMGDNFYLGDRDGVRTPMQWSPDRNAGFSSTNPHKLYLPVIIDPLYHFESVNVETQRANTSSLFWFMKRMINMRKKFKAFGRGDFNVIPVDNPKILAFTRSYEDERILVVVNLSKYSQPVELDLNEFSGYTILEAFSRNHFPIVREQVPYFLTLGPHDYQWFVLEKTEANTHLKNTYELATASWNELPVSEQLLADVLPDYLMKVNWFIGRRRKLYDVQIINNKSITAGKNKLFMLVLQVGYESGLPEQYFLPVGLIKGRRAKLLQTDYPQAVISKVTVGEESGLLVDAVYLTEFHERMLDVLAGKAKDENLSSDSSGDLADLVNKNEELRSRMLAGEQLNTSITYGNKYFLKIYRKIDAGSNSDVELSRYLSQHNQYPYTPAMLGTIDLRMDGKNLTIGMLEQMIENHGNGKQFMNERINNYIERVLARDKNLLSTYQVSGSLSAPVALETLSEELKEFIGSGTDMAKLIGARTAELHRLLASATAEGMRPEEFSLHYQRSLFSGMQTLVRETFQNIEKNLGRLPEEHLQSFNDLLKRRHDILDFLKQIYTKKLDIIKTRIHGLFGLEEVLLTGKDVMIHNFNGNPLRSFSERRLKRSPLRDVASMIRSIHYVTYGAFNNSSQIRKEEMADLMKFADFWAFYISSFFMQGYLECIGKNTIVPSEKDDFEMLLKVYLIENSLHYLNWEVSNHYENAIIPLRIINRVLDHSIV